MDDQQIQSLIEAIVRRCEQAKTPLSNQQQEILEQVLVEFFTTSIASEASSWENPLDELTSEQREALLEFIIEQREGSWKAKLLNDWLQGKDSGKVQFLRKEYGPQWLNRVQPYHLAQYLENSDRAQEIQLQIGDRIEVSNFVWEWVQDDNPDWYPATVINLSQGEYKGHRYQNCTIRFDNGEELEIPGVYQWNLYNWRLAQSSQ
ncbi:hypothetical protein FRE64_08140 [Euhalothece natronophila Z-M001]|uniref:Uncharacterized protein n=1 Tax=Euhalothece natronophila Z-M001 TaxID=522448 RepID=A0A5B8NNZ4_9CHRO|nr:hypothetical protein [Euhalothece natronophila]QDZ39915.1 hypothetical protein FRE64_08140 [Euhalothece natronophila Z-M001]